MHIYLFSQMQTSKYLDLEERLELHNQRLADRINTLRRRDPFSSHSSLQQIRSRARNDIKYNSRRTYSTTSRTQRVSSRHTPSRPFSYFDPLKKELEKVHMINEKVSFLFALSRRRNKDCVCVCVRVFSPLLFLSFFPLYLSLTFSNFVS